MMRFRAILVAAISLAATTAWASSGDWIRQSLEEAIPNACGREASAAQGTLQRLQGVNLPDAGKVIVVNIAAGIVTAYEDGVPVIESRAVVGQPSTPTPEMTTHVTYIRPNPTWTVPESIIGRKQWREKLASDPGYFDDNGFDISVGGHLISPWDAAASGSRATAFVQRPGENNALGLLKIGLHDSDAIYIHDTNDPGRFEAEVRSASAGCVRVERVRDIAAWVLGIGTDRIDSMISDGDVASHPPISPVKVILGYWTAWPDATGGLRFYPDIYDLDEPSRECSGSGTRSYEPTPERRRADPEPSSSFAPSPSQGVWTEYVTR